MDFRVKLKNSATKSYIACWVVVLTVLYCCFSLIKGLYLWSFDGTSAWQSALHQITDSIITNTAFFPLDLLWNAIPEMPFNGSIIDFYKILAPPMVITLLCTFFMIEYRFLKVRIIKMKRKIRKDARLAGIQRNADAGSVPESALIEMIINNAANITPPWHDSWWGRIAIGVAIMLIVTAVGLR